MTMFYIFTTSIPFFLPFTKVKKSSKNHKACYVLYIPQSHLIFWTQQTNSSYPKSRLYREVVTYPHHIQLANILKGLRCFYSIKYTLLGNLSQPIVTNMVTISSQTFHLVIQMFFIWFCKTSIGNPIHIFLKFNVTLQQACAIQCQVNNFLSSMLHCDKSVLEAINHQQGQDCHIH